MKVLLLGDGCVLTTGFGQVLRHTATALVNAGHQVAQIAGLDAPPFCDSRPYHRIGVRPYFTSAGDTVGLTLFDKVNEHFEPDAVFVNADPGSVVNWWNRALSAYPDMPVVAYMPIEGAPINPLYAEAFRRVTTALTYTRWGSARLQAEHGIEVGHVPHGVNTAIFKPLQPEDRDVIRRDLGWADKFVVMFVGRNVGRKGHDRLIRAIKILAGNGADDVILYLHCLPSENNTMGGWNLQEVAYWEDVGDRVFFAGQTDPVRGEAALTLAQRYAAADLFVSASEVEGFGLPLLEAMASGLPVIVPDDGGVQMEVTEGARFAAVAPVDWGTWFHGGRLCRVAPEALAYAINLARTHPEAMAKARAAGIRRAAQHPWAHMTTRLVRAIEEAPDAARARRDDAIRAASAGMNTITVPPETVTA